MRSNVDAPRLSSACESNPYSEDHHIPVFLSWMTRQFIALIFNYRNSSSIAQIIIISIITIIISIIYTIYTITLMIKC